MSLQIWGEEIACIDHPLTTLGIHLGTRTTVVRRQNGIWLHSPGPLQAEDIEAVRAMGPVREIVAPNAMHHLYVAAARAAFPGAKVITAAAVAKKQPTLPIDEFLGESALFLPELDQHRLRGMENLDETVFFHIPSRTLILTDLAFHICEAPGIWTAMMMTLNDAWKKFGPSRVFRNLIQDPKKLRTSLDHILSWDFDRISVTHGQLVKSGGKELFRQAFAWVS